MSPNVVGEGTAWGFYFFFYNIAKSSLQDIRREDTVGPLVRSSLFLKLENTLGILVKQV